MHFMPDTEEEDSAAEQFWPEGYKRVAREDLRQLLGTVLDGEKFKSVYEQQYTERFSDLGEFTARIADMVAIGAENGADDAFDDIISAFLTESPLPEERKYACYFLPEAFPDSVTEKLAQTVITEYSQDNIYNHAYKVGYQKRFRTFDDYMSQVARLVVLGTINGVDDMLEGIYRSFMTDSPLPPARRHPRRLKTW